MRRQNNTEALEIRRRLMIRLLQQREIAYLAGVSHPAQGRETARAEGGDPAPAVKPAPVAPPVSKKAKRRQELY